MANKSAEFLVAVLASTALVLSPVTAEAGGMSHFGNTGGPGIPKVNCPEPSHPSVPNRSITINRPVTTNISNTLNVYKPVTVTNNIDVSKNITINKPITITNNIDNSKNIEINKNIDNSKYIEINKSIDNSKYIDNSKNITINKNINIDKGSSEAEAVALAAAVAAAAAASSSSSSATVNFNGSSSASANASAMSSSFSNAATYNNSGFAVGVSSYVAEAPGFVGGGDVNVNVSAAEAAPAACTYQAATVIKAIHAICVSADHHEFPASHMVGDTWINAGYEGEIARCLPGSSLKVTVGSVTQSSEGAAVSNAHGETMVCGPHEALRHLKNGMLKCAPAEKVVDCTERTNLRKWGTGDMFFSYVAQVCLETGREYVGEQSRETDAPIPYGYRSLRNNAAGAY